VSADARQQETATRGRLRIYLGYAPGAGTTCALLREGHQRARLGADVVVAHAQTHGRPHTQALLAGLEIIPAPHSPTWARWLRSWIWPRCWPAGPRLLWSMSWPTATRRARLTPTGGRTCRPCWRPASR
jgi:hypothetical protein